MKNQCSTAFFLYPMFSVIGVTLIPYILIVIRIKHIRVRRLIPVAVIKIFTLTAFIVILGISWLLSNLTFLSKSDLHNTQIIFVVLASVQGLLMCYFYCITYFY